MLIWCGAVLEMGFETLVLKCSCYYEIFVKDSFQRTDVFHCTHFRGLQRVKFIIQLM